MFDSAAECPTWSRFLSEIMGGDENLIGYLQRLTGYCLTADATEQALFIFHGSGSNGKNVFLDTLTSLLGDYAGTAPPSLLMLKRNPEHPTELADLMGRRLVVASETDEGGRLNVNLVKQLTGNARLKGRFMRQDFFEFDRTFKLVLMTNHLPVIRETTHAAWRRLRLVPFGVTIPDEKQDRHLIDKLRADWPGILAWAVRGCLIWQEAGLRTPEAVLNVTKTYREESNPLADFLTERCIIMPSATVSRADIFDTYQKWAERNGDRNPLERTMLFERLRGLPGVSDSRGRKEGKISRGFTGIGLCFSTENGRDSGKPCQV
jgi:putative DNA primase/helicase